ncbi:unnamed protein product [Didymodactylos carnosus]|uniref:Alpha-glucosidase n=1 Tax=Didymodactylos carnosus TaxID=1234261 RepID=A0A8S2ED17_9BILA|nr:unnamed protein product [Didymodactylos carnosus]CAF4002304.1 unnamed protein product [Didymodactylos carnosus]
MPQYFGSLPTTTDAWTAIGRVHSIKHEDKNTIHLQCDNARVSISVLDSNLVRVRLCGKDEEFLPQRPWGVTLDDSEWIKENSQIIVQESQDSINIQTRQIRISIQREKCLIAFFDDQNRAFAQDTDIGMGWRMGSVAGWKKIENDEHFYGFGERTGYLDKLSEIKTNWAVNCLDFDSLTDEMYMAIPFYIALRSNLMYGFYFNTTYWSQFDIGCEKPGQLKYETRHGGQLDYYVMYGKQPSEIIRTYTQLTGRMPLPPKWALGYHQCRWSYESENIVRDLAKNFRQRKIPCDVIHLDIDYMRGYRVFTWSNKRFPNAKQMINDIKQEGFKVVPIIDPVKYEPEADFAPFDEGMENDYFVRHRDGRLFHGYAWPEKIVFPDFVRSSVREWWGNIHKTLIEDGVCGIWNDMNEPAVSDRPIGDGGAKICFPLDAIHDIDRKRQDDTNGPINNKTVILQASASHSEVHNLYGLLMTRSTAEGLRRLRPKERSFLLTRSGFAGVQRYSAVWMGDNHSKWDYLETSMPMLCNMGLSGVSFVGADIGGFASNATAELFARWMQLGVLYPFCRGHSAMTTARHEPWTFGEKVENICRDYLNLRYQLLPYLYTLFWESSMTGSPILRPLLYHYFDDSKTYALYDQVLLGEWLMAAPIYRQGVECRCVYLPRGTWYDWWTNEIYEGSKYILASAPLEKMPLYVRSCAIIPMQPIVQHTNEIVNKLFLNVYPPQDQNERGEFILYEDDGNTFDYQYGIYSTTKFCVYIDESKNICLDIEERLGQWKPVEREIIINLKSTKQAEQRVLDDGKAHSFKFNFQ